MLCACPRSLSTPSPVPPAPPAPPAPRAPSGRALSSGLLALLSLTACGEERLPAEHWLGRLSDPVEARRDEAVRELGRWGREDPERIVPLLVRQMEQVRGRRLSVALQAQPELGPGPTDAERANVVARTVHALHARLRLLGRATPQTRIDGARIDLLVIPPDGVTDMEAEERSLLAALRRPGAVELRAELPAPFTTTPERPVSPFPGSAEDYAAWLAEDTRRLEAAAAGGSPYVPSVEGRELLRRHAENDAPDAGLVPTLVPRDVGERFDETSLVINPADDPYTGTPSLYVTALEGRLDAFRVLLSRHAGLRLWLCVDGEAVLSGLLPGQPGVVVSFPVRGPGLPEARTRAARFVALASVGRYPTPLELRALPRAPVIAPDDPVARALVEVGLPAEAALDALAKRDASWVPLVARLKEDIVRGQTRRGS